jgi:dTMP kinase
MKPTPQPLTNGLLVVFEGIDGSGKSTQAKLAYDTLQAAGWTSLYATRNLGGTPVGEALRKVILSPVERPGTTNLYISVAIQEALIGAIQTERGKGSFILMDRGPLSLAAYEIYGGGLDETLGWQHVDDGMAKLKPELTIIYRTDVKTALERTGQKTKQADYFESQPPSYFERVAQGYEAAAKRYGQHVAVLDGDQSIETVHAQTMQAIVRTLNSKLQA